MSDLKVGSVPLGEYDHDHFLVMTRLKKVSTRANVATLITCYVRQKWDEYENILRYTANKAGISEEECYQILLSGTSVDQLLGEPTPTEPDADIPEMG
jgi:hypothetical protein